MTIVALTIAGSDPSGGAGIQADLRTFAALGVVGVSAITALTVQNSLGVQSVHPVPADVLAAQMEAILSDTKVQAVKIGMLGGAAQVRAVAAALRKYSPPNVVLDPVLASTGGVPLLDDEGRKALLTELMPLCDLITPNLSEAEALTGLTVHDLKTAQAAGEQLIQAGAKAVLIKGGHLLGKPDDFLILPRGHEISPMGWYLLRGRRIETPHTHGTGCFLSSATAAYLAKGLRLEQAIVRAKMLLKFALSSPVVIGQGRGHPDVVAAAIALENNRHTHEQKRERLQGLYVLTDPDLRPDRSAEETVQATLAGGARVIQIREKRLVTPQLAATVRQLAHQCSIARGLLIVNDRVDVALAANADGVHLGPDDMKPEDARRLLGPDKLVGVSVATVEEAKAAAPFASYFGVGAIFGSKTKLDAGEPIGVGRIREIKAAFPGIPIVAIGGITVNNIAEVAAAGADAAAVVSAVVGAPDMEAATRELVARFEAEKAHVNGIQSDHSWSGLNQP